MSSESDSDFGEFDEASSLEIGSDTSLEKCLSVGSLMSSLLGNSKLPQFERKHCNLESLLEEERPKIIYEQLVLLESHLRPLKWPKSDIRLMLLRTLNIEEQMPQPLKPKILQDSLYVELEGNKNSLESLGIEKLNERVSDVEVSTLLGMSSFEDMSEDSLSIVHDQLIVAIHKVLIDINEMRTKEQELLEDKSTFEQVIINLVGHAQRIRREEIALYKKRNKALPKKK